MGTHIKLKGVVFQNDALPTLGSYGEIPQGDLLGLYDFATADTYLDDKSGNANDLTIDPSATDFSYSNGILTAGSGASQLNMGVNKVGIPFTGVVAIQIPAVNAFYTWRQDTLSRGVHMRVDPEGVVSAYYNDGLNRTPEGNATALKSVGDYALYAFACDGTSVSFSLDGAAWASEAITTPGGITVPNGSSTDQIQLGSAGTGGAAMIGGIGFAAYWDRALTSEEIRRVYLASKGIMAGKGLSI